MAHHIQRWAKPQRRRSIVLSAVFTASTVGLLAACSSTTASTTGITAGLSSTNTLSTRQLTGVGTALVDQSGRTVYTPDQEADGKIDCIASCLSFWFPVTVASSVTPSVASRVTGSLGTIKRPDDGKIQVTYNGKPLYTFRLDEAPGDDKGVNVQDNFGGTAFTWQAINTSDSQGGGGSGGSTPASSPAGSANYGSGGYGY